MNNQVHYSKLSPLGRFSFTTVLQGSPKEWSSTVVAHFRMVSVHYGEALVNKAPGYLLFWLLTENLNETVSANSDRKASVAAVGTMGIWATSVTYSGF